jgi:HEAT repeat protein
MLLYLIRIMSQNKASRESMRVLEDFLPNNVLTRRLPVKIASLLGVELPRSRPPRITIDGVGDILETVDNALEEMAETGRINVLVSMLLHGRKPTRIAAASVLKAVGEEAVPAIVAAIQLGSFDSIRLSAREMAEVLKEIDPDPVGSLLKFLKSEDHRIQYGVLLLLRALGMRKAVKHLVEMLKNPSIRLRIFVVRSLGGIKGKKATEGLIAALKDRNRFVRMEAIKELKERMGSPGVRDAVSERQQDRSKHVREMAQEVITG